MMESVMAGASPGEEVVGDVDPGDEASNASAVSSDNQKYDISLCTPEPQFIRFEGTTSYIYLT